MLVFGAWGTGTNSGLGFSFGVGGVTGFQRLVGTWVESVSKSEPESNLAIRSNLDPTEP